MEIFLYRQGAAQVEEGFTVEQLPDLLKNEADVVWVDMEAPTEADERALLEVFNFHPLTVEDCRENRHYPKIEEFPGYLYFWWVKTRSTKSHEAARKEPSVSF